MTSPDPSPILDGKFRGLLDYAHKLTLAPAECTRSDVDQLRDQGASDEEVHSTVQVAAYFNYINRIADALGVDLEPEMQARSQDETNETD